MPLELQNRVLQLVIAILPGAKQRTPDWLMRAGQAECGKRWGLVQTIYADLTGRELPNLMPPRERRTLDLVWRTPDSTVRVIEVDESQHFNCFRAQTLRHYPPDLNIAFSAPRWIEESEKKLKLEGGGFAKPRPPLFPQDGGRHQQRAFRDALADILPSEYGFAPTLRLAYFEVQDWLHDNDAQKKMTMMLRDRGILN
jgi:hypothetical protein